MSATYAPGLPPGSLGLPIIGETIAFLTDPDFAPKRRARYGPVFKTRIAGSNLVYLCGQDALKFVLVSGLDHFSSAGALPQATQMMLRDSLLVQEGETWRQQRQMLAPAFHGSAITGYVSTMNTVTDRYLKQWERRGSFAWYDEFKKLTFEVTSRLLLGVEPGTDVDELSQLFGVLLGGMLAIRPSRLRWTRFGRAMAAREAVLSYVKNAIAARKQHPTHDALSLLVQARDENGTGFSEEELVNQAIFLLVAGHETTTSMLTLLCLELARNPHVLARCRAEQQQFDATQPVTTDQLRHMPYLELVLKELERVHPAVIGSQRRVVKAFDMGGYHVPVGWNVSYSIDATHMDAETYPQPHLFDPERFSPERAEHKKRPFSLVGFGAGPRICLGMTFAQTEIGIVIAKLLRGYEWELAAGQSLKVLLVPTRHPKDGLRVWFQPRKGAAA